jgi:hypothetical protein
LLSVVKVSFGSHSLVDYCVAVVNSGCLLFGADRTNVSFPEAAKKLDLPLLAVSGHSSVTRTSSALSNLHLIFAPKYNTSVVLNASKLLYELVLFGLE